MTFKEKIKAIKLILSKLISTPESIFLILKDETNYKRSIQKKYGIDRLRTVDINHFLKERKEQIESYTFLDGSSLVTDLALLKALAASIPDCEYLELGTWRGESIINVSKVAKHCTSVNLSPDEILKITKMPEYAAQHNCLIKDKSNITSVFANTLTFDFSTLNKKFDLIFVDADHSYEAVKSDTAKVAALLKDENSMIVWHDCGLNTETPRYSVIAGVLDGLPAGMRQHLYHVSNTICAIYTQKQLDSYIIKPPHQPDKIFSVSIESSTL